ncbi:MAG: hypothetical protein ABF281_07520 [Wenyingzhuangia sp.]|jgi:hypothetical protein
MQTVLLFLSLYLNMTGDHCNDLKEIRSMFQQGVQNKRELNIMIDLCKVSNCKKTIPYFAAATMRKSEFSVSPIEKLKNFNKGKKILETYIAKCPNDIEAKYIRWLTQTKAPRFLRYNQNTREDYQFIIENIAKSNVEKNYQKVILDHLQNLENE